MGKLVHLPVESSRKFGLEQVKKRRKRKPKSTEDPAQLQLFEPAHTSEAKVINFPIDRSFFEEALVLDGEDDQQAKALYEKAVSTGECIADAYCNLGIIEFRNGNSIGAIDCLTKALKDDPRHFEGHYNLANIYSDVGNYALAQTHYRLATEIDPTSPNVFFNLALVSALTKDIAQAIFNLERYLELAQDPDPEAQQLLNNLRNSAQ